MSMVFTALKQSPLGSGTGIGTGITVFPDEILQHTLVCA